MADKITELLSEKFDYERLGEYLDRFCILISMNRLEPPDTIRILAHIIGVGFAAFKNANPDFPVDEAFGVIKAHVLEAVAEWEVKGPKAYREFLERRAGVRFN